MQFAEYICKRLKEIGCEYIFGVPGSYIMPLWQATQNNINLTLARHESGAAYMADGWARFSKKLGVVLTTIGPGITNVVTGIASANQDSVPILLITGQAKCEKIGTGVFQESSNYSGSFVPTELMKCISKASFEINSPQNAVCMFERALMLSLYGRQGPVHLSIPIDIQTCEVDCSWQESPKFRLGTIKSGFYEDDEVFEKIYLLDRSLILIGGGCFLGDCSEEVYKLSCMLDVPIISTIKGLSAVSYNWDTFIGHIGPGSRKETLEFLKDYKPKSLIVLGASMSSYYMEELRMLLKVDELQIIQIDKCPEQLGNKYKVQLGINCDVKFMMKELLRFLSTKNNMYKINNKKIIKTWRNKVFSYSYINNNYNWGFMSESIYKLNDLLQENVTVIADAGNHYLDTLSLYRTKRPYGFLANSGLGAMGYAIGASIGAKLARPSNRIICISGDGSMLMSGNEISVAAYLGLDNVYIVYNNMTHGRVRFFQKYQMGNKIVATDIGAVNFCEFAAAQGLSAYRVNNMKEFVKTMQQVLKNGQTSLIEVMVSKDEIPFCFLRKKGEVL